MVRNAVFALMAVLLMAAQAFAIMPPRVYAERSEKAEIKAIAVVTDVKVLEVGESYSTKRVTFETEYAITKDTKKKFIVFCKSVDSKEQEENIIFGGNVYFYPAKGERAFVTATGNGGEITSMTPLTPELEKAIRTAPETIRYGISSAGVEKGDN